MRVLPDLNPTGTESHQSTPTQFFVESMTNLVVQSELVDTAANTLVPDHQIGANPLTTEHSPETVIHTPAQTPSRQLHRSRIAAPIVASTTAQRENSIQRNKAKYARPGSRRERRWQNRQMLLPTLEDLELEGPRLLGGLAQSTSCFEQLFKDPEMLDNWEEMITDSENARRRMNKRVRNPPPSRQSQCSHLSCRERFLRIDRNHRQQLRTTHIPQGVTDAIESRLLTFFGQGADGRARRLLVEQNTSDNLLDWEVVELDNSTKDVSEWVEVGHDADVMDGNVESSCSNNNNNNNNNNHNINHPNINNSDIAIMSRVVQHDDHVLAAGCRPGRLQIHEPNSFNRSILHSCAQYMNLNTNSETMDDGRRITTVTNKHHPQFIPPEIPLSEYLKSL